MKKIYITLIALLGVFAFTSCDDFLTTNDPSKLPEKEAYETIQDCDNALNGAYRSMYNYIASFPASYDAASDDIKYTSWGNGYAVTNALFSWNSGSSGFTSQDSPWAILYDQAVRVNKLLDEIEKFAEDTDTKRIKGEAYMLRAMGHFELLRLYGHKFNKATANSDLGIPYVKKAYDFNVKNRATVAENLKDIHADLSNAERMMQKRSEKAIYYLSIDALNAFRTRVYLYEENYAEVIVAADKLTTYAVANTVDELHAIWAGDLPLNEVIYMIGFTSNEATGEFSLAESMYFGDKDTKGLNRANYLPSAELLNLYSAYDKRYNVYFRLADMNPGTTNGDQMIVVNKYPGNSNLSTVDKVNQTKYLRYSEVLLNKIEALYHTNEAKAQAQLNLFRTKRISNYTNQSLSGEALLNEIKIERRREFAFEGMRFHDLRRWNDGFVRTKETYTPISHGIVVKADDYHWVYPIPQSEMDANSLPSSYQNPGYINK